MRAWRAGGGCDGALIPPVGALFGARGRSAWGTCIADGARGMAQRRFGRGYGPARTSRTCPLGQGGAPRRDGGSGVAYARERKIKENKRKHTRKPTEKLRIYGIRRNVLREEK